MNYQVMPNLANEEYEELKRDIAERGVMVPIEYDEAGNVLDGHHRLKICAELGIEDYPKVIRAGMTEEEKRTHARKLNMARRHLTQEQRRGLIREQLRETPEKSDRQIASGLGVSDKTVGGQRKEMERCAEIPHVESSVDTLGREQPRQRKPVSVFNPTPREERAIQKPEVIERLANGDNHALDEKPHIANNSGNNEWYTPAEYIEAAREVMGGIDLDPASCEIANRIVQADAYYTAETNGLLQRWAGRVWLNPPYAGELIPQFIDKLKQHTEARDIEHAIVLVNNATETAWFNALISVASAVVFPKSRVKFYMPDGKTGAPLQGQAVVYVGNNSDRFMQVFSPFGWGAVF